MQLSIYPEPDLYVVFFRTDMQITGTFTYTLGKDWIYKTNNRCFLGHSLKWTDFYIFCNFCFVGFLIILHFFHIFKDTANTGIGTVKSRMELIEILLGTNNRFNFAISIDFNCINRIDIHGIKHGHSQKKPAFTQRCYLVFISHVCRNDICQFCI